MSLRTLLSVSLALFIAGLLPPHAQAGSDTQQPAAPVLLHMEGAVVAKDLRYGDAENGGYNLLDLYLPVGTVGKVPVVVAVHGGGFAIGSKEMFGPKALALAQKGYAVAAINYRLKPAYLPIPMYDVKAAIRWVRAHATDYSLDPDKIGVLGGSAGAVLAALAGTSAGVQELEGEVGEFPGISTRLQAAVALAGVYREFAWIVRSPEGGAPSQELVKLCAPVTHVSPDDPPFLLVIGDMDITPGGIEDHRRFHEALTAQRVDSTLSIVPGGKHGQCFDRDLENIVNFLDKHLKAESVAEAGT